MTADSPLTHQLRARAARYMAGGVLHHLSAVAGRPPIVVVRGQGSRIWDSDGREYIDYYLGSASLVLGHAHSVVVDAVERQLANGSHFYELSPAAIDLAELVVKAVPSAERLKYAMSGTDAVLAAVRVARAHTGRNKILKFEGAYHGSNDWMLWGYRHRRAITYPQAQPDSAGVPSELQPYVLIAPYNDLDKVTALVKRHRHELAAVIAEPLLGNIPPRPGFLEGVRKLTRDHDIPLIFDEVVTGFRMALGGAQEYYRVTPDLTALGKSLGGGHPIGALVGRADLMAYFAPVRVSNGNVVLHVGTHSGNPVSCAAGAATLRELKKPNVFTRLHAIGRQLGNGLREISARLGIPTFVVNEGPMVDLWFTEREIAAYPDTWSADSVKGHRFKLGLVDRGVWSPPGHKMFLSLAHTDDDVVRTLEAAEASMKAL